jgi:hypothetical protein
MQRKAGLTAQSLIAALGAAYVGAFLSFLLLQLWQFQMAPDARICPVGARGFSDWCTLGELSLALFFDFIWALYGLPFAVVLTIPCAVGLGRLAPVLERRFKGRSLALAQYGLGASLGIAAGALLGPAVAGLAAGCAGVWIFRRLRYPGGRPECGAGGPDAAS